MESLETKYKRQMAWKRAQVAYERAHTAFILGKGSFAQQRAALTRLANAYRVWDTTTPCGTNWITVRGN